MSERVAKAKKVGVQNFPVRSSAVCPLGSTARECFFQNELYLV